MIAAAHFPASITITLALGLTGWIMWYWQRLGRADVPDSRRRIRRASIIVMFLSLPIFVRALSFIDPENSGPEYMITWLLALFALGLVVVTAGIDVIDTLRIQRREDRQRVGEAVDAFIKGAKAGRKTKAAKSNGEDKEP